MNKREVILKAADQIEQHPEQFEFFATGYPDAHCSTPGCALGWIAFFSDDKPTKDAMRQAQDFLDIHWSQFYRRLDVAVSSEDWRFDAVLCADALRKYADKYYPEGA